MSEFLLNLSGRVDSGTAKLIGNYASDQAGGADSFQYAAWPNPLNVAVGILSWFVGVDFGYSAKIHFASEKTLAKGEKNFAGYIDYNDSKHFDLQKAGFLLHSIEDVHGAHLGFGLPLGHLSAGHDVDRVVGDMKFINVANETLQFLTGNKNARITPKQLNDLIDAIIKRCGDKAKDLKIYRPFSGPWGGGAGGPFGGGFGGYPWWYTAAQEFAAWVGEIGLREITRIIVL